MTRVTEVIPGPEGDIIPVVIVCQAEEGDGISGCSRWIHSNLKIHLIFL